MNEMSKIDCLNRGAFIDQTVDIIEKLSKEKKNCCFSIDGKWGSGKSFVINKIEERLPKYNFEEEDGYIVFRYNCWKYDYYEEPIEAIVNVIFREIDRICSFDGWDQEKIKKLKSIRNIILNIGSQLLANIVKFDIYSAIKDESENKNDLLDFDKNLRDLQESIGELATENTIVFLVDEIDRCLPEYAIKVLERLHHICYDIKNVISVVAVDKKQLERTIENQYGTEKECSYEYLKKFFNFSLELDNGNVNNWYEKKYKKYISYFDYNENDFEMFFGDFDIGMDSRSIERILDLSQFIHELIAEEKKYRLSLLFIELILIMEREEGVNFSTLNSYPGGEMVEARKRCKYHREYDKFKHRDAPNVRKIMNLNEEAVNIRTAGCQAFWCNNEIHNAYALYRMLTSPLEFDQVGSIENGSKNLFKSREGRQSIFFTDNNQDDFEFIKKYKQTLNIFKFS